MPNYRKQKNLTISEEQKKFIEVNNGKMSISELSKMLGLTVNKVQKNREMLGLVKVRKAKVIQMLGYFDVDQFQKKYYNF